ncbi:mate-domain-containing protein [Neocallimastix californiae]|uniref:Mate-domain-containing protein n=1 Tax=Neocallimastix californiae TaxID=1754190 RepID=A0A1Y2ATK3_9FUNG|nr:mate-domain-containing protein [Neocallimastix californiae]|eukprot:ORY25882.1 mate-domain-containing protein [Neocallimastix californiae]
MLEKIIEPKKQISKEQQIFSNKRLWQLIYPILVEQILILLVGIADTLIVSYAGESAVSGVSLVNQINNIFIIVFMSLASGGAVIVSQYIGRNELDKGKLSSGQLIMISFVISIIIGAILLVSREILLRFLFGKTEVDVMEASITYLTITVLSFPALAVHQACSAIFRSMAKTKITMYVSFLMNVINLSGNMIGVFLLKAGVKGVAIPSLISRCVAAFIMLVACFYRKNIIFVKFKYIFHFNKEIIKRILHIAIPNAIEGGLLEAAKVVLNSIVALFGTSQIAANGVSQNLFNMSSLFSSVMGPVFITVIGHILFHPCTFTLASGLRAAGDVKFTLYSGIFSTVVVRVLSAFILGIWLNMGVIGVTFSMVIDWSVRFTVNLLRYKSGKWKTFEVI